MRTLFFLTILMLPLALGACRTTAQGEHGSVIVDDGYRHDGYHDSTGHCPPGHHMKGWC